MVVGVVRAGRDLVVWQFYWTVRHQRRHTYSSLKVSRSGGQYPWRRQLIHDSG